MGQSEKPSVILNKRIKFLKSRSGEEYKIRREELQHVIRLLNGYMNQEDFISYDPTEIMLSIKNHK